MKKILYLLQIVVLVGICSCEETVPTQRVVVYDDKQPPVIVNLDSAAGPLYTWVDSEYKWNVNISAYNGIDSIIVNGKPFKVFNNGQLIYNTPISVYMSDVYSLEITLRVVDEIGLSTECAPFYIYAQGRIPSPYLLLDWSLNNYAVVTTDNPEYVRFPREVATPTTGVDQYWGSWLKPSVSSDLGITSVLMGVAWNGSKYGTDNFAYGFGVQAPDGSKALSIKQTVYFMLNAIVLNTNISEKIIYDLKNGNRELKLDVFVDTSNSTAFNINSHGQICIGMGNVSKFHNDTPQQGQDNGMSARISKTGEWETLTFKLDPNNSYIRTKNDINNDEVNMLFLMPSPHFKGDGVALSDAVYYFKNLRVEKVQ